MSHRNRVAGQGEVGMHDTDTDRHLTRFGRLAPSAPRAECRRFQILSVRVDFVDGSRRDKELSRSA